MVAPSWIEELIDWQRSIVIVHGLGLYLWCHCESRSWTGDRAESSTGAAPVSAPCARPGRKMELC